MGANTGQGRAVGLNDKQARRYAVLQRVLAGTLSKTQAAQELDLSRRQVIRLSQAVQAEGPLALVSGNVGKVSNRRIDQAEQQRISGLVQAHYADFGPTLAAQYLKAHHGFERSTETLRSWMMQARLWKAKVKRAKPIHPMRQRRSRRGELIQIDGSHHDWFEARGPKCCLIAFIDDATSQVLAARFEPQESTQGYFEVLQQHINAHGVPLALYSDKAAIFTKSNPDDLVLTQFERALLQLQIEPICAHTPQAKGRVERLFKTLQDRLCKAMRLQGISSIEQANAWIGQYLRQHNQDFGIPAQDCADAHRAWDKGAGELNRICAIHHSRVLSDNLSCNFQGSVIQVLPAQAIAAQARKQSVGIVQYPDERLEIVYRGQLLAHRVFRLHPGAKRANAQSAKGINDHVDALVTRMASAMAQVQHQEAQRHQARTQQTG